MKLGPLLESVSSNYRRRSLVTATEHEGQHGEVWELDEHPGAITADTTGSSGRATVVVASMRGAFRANVVIVGRA